MKPIYNLPPFGARAIFPSATTTGEWTRAGGTLAALAQSLLIGNDDERAGAADIKSIPDPWAQIRTFADAVGGAHPLHEQSVAQWRGLLALFALSAVNDDVYQLVTTPVPLRSAAEGGGLFQRILTRLPPLDRLPQLPAGGDEATATAEWRRPVIVSLQMVRGQDGNGRFSYDQAVPIGVLNPACLIAPGRRTASKPFPAIKWLEQGLSDPTALTAAAALPMSHYLVLRDWLMALDADLRTIAGGPQPGLARIRTQIDAYIADCAALCAGCRVATQSAPGADAQLPPLYGALRRRTSLAPCADPAAVSECRIDLRPDLANPPFKGVILVDPQIAATRKTYAKDVVVWGNVTLGELQQSPGKLEPLRQEVSAAGYLLATPRDLLTRRLAQLSHKAIVDGHMEGTRGQLLPLSPLALLLLDPAALAEASDCRDQGGDRVVVSLALSLAGPAAARHVLARSYAERPLADEGLLERDVDWTFGEAAVWPNFRSASWKWYFLRLTYTTSGVTIRARFGLSGAALATFLSGEPEADRRSLLPPWCDESRCLAERQAPLSGRTDGGGAPWLQRMRNIENSGAVEEYQSSDQGFEALFFSRTADGGEPFPIGCSLLSTLKPASSGADGVVAVDFGTTNTVACFEDQIPVAFKDRILHPIRSADRARTDRGLQSIRWPFLEFMPPSERSTPTPTVGLNRDADQPALLAGPEGLGDERPLFGSVIYFQPDEGAAADMAASDLEQFRGVLGRTRFNLKWGEEKEIKTAARRYLRQFIMMTAAEAVMKGKDPSKLTWRFSRPDAMSIDQRQELEGELASALEEVAPGAAFTHLYSEGAAAAKYILGGGRGGDRSRGLVNVILDIGGGTTDVAIWAADELVWTGSYRLAGGQFFTQHLVNNPGFFRTFGLSGWADIIAPSDDRAIRIEPAFLSSVGELLFSGPKLGETLNKRWSVNSGTPEAKALMRTAFTFLGGLAWYLGLAVRGLADQKAIEIAALQNVTFALCGRGSGLFGRLHGPAPLADTTVSRILSLFALAAGVESPGRPSVFVSPTPKIEVVAGMVSPSRLVDLEAESRRENLRSFEPCGLNVPLKGGGLLAADADITTLPPGVRADYPVFDELKPFLAGLAAEGGFHIDLRPGNPEGTHTRIRNEVFTLVQLHSAGLREAPFITALRTLVSDMARNDSERASHLTITDATQGRR